MTRWITLLILVLAISAVAAARQSPEPALGLSHDDQVRSAMWNTDESSILTAGWDGTIRLWDAVTGEQLLQMEPGGRVNGIQWNPDESYLLAYNQAGEVSIWDGVSGQKLATLPPTGAEVRRAMWFLDDDKILVQTAVALEIWNWREERVLYTLGNGAPLLDFTWNSGFIELVTVHQNGEVLVWTWNMEEPRYVLDVYPQLADADSPDPEFIWSAGQAWVVTWSGVDGESPLTIWERHGGALKHPLFNTSDSNCPENNVITAEINQWEGMIMTGGLDAIQVCNYVNDRLLLTIPTEAPVLHVAWTTDLTRIISQRYTAVDVWDTATGEQLHTFPEIDGVREFKLSPDESLLLIRSDGGRELHVYELASGSLIATLPHDDLVWGANWNQNGRQILSWSVDGTAKVWTINAPDLNFAQKVVQK